MYIEQLIKFASSFTRNDEFAFLDRWEFGKTLRSAVASGEIRSVREAFKLLTDAGFAGMRSDVEHMYDLGEASIEEVNGYLRDYHREASSPWEFFKKLRRPPTASSTKAEVRDATRALKKPFRQLIGMEPSEAELSRMAFEVVSWAMDNHPEAVVRLLGITPGESVG